MIVPKKNTLRSISEKAEYLDLLWQLGVITNSEYESAKEDLRIKLGLPAKKQIEIKPNVKLHTDDFKPKNVFKHNGVEEGIE
jgi:hypothetical protein